MCGINYFQFAICLAEVNAPNKDGFEFEIIFAAEIFPVDATNDEPENGRISGDCDIRAVGGFGNFLNYCRKCNFSGVRSFDARVLGVDFAKTSLIRI